MNCRRLPGGCGGATALSLRNVSRAAAARALLNVTLPAVSEQDDDWVAGSMWPHLWLSLKPLGRMPKHHSRRPQRHGRIPAACSSHAQRHADIGGRQRAAWAVHDDSLRAAAIRDEPTADKEPTLQTRPRPDFHWRHGSVHVVGPGRSRMPAGSRARLERDAAARRRRGQLPQAPRLSVVSSDFPCCPCSRPCGAGTVDGGGKARGPRFQAGAAALWLARPQHLAGRGRLGKLRGAPRA